MSELVSIKASHSGSFGSAAPEMVVTVELDDPSVCYWEHDSYAVAADVTIETGGVTLTAENSFGYAVPVDFTDSANEPNQALQTSFRRYCVDVSQSLEWQMVPGADPDTKLCVGASTRGSLMKRGGLLTC